MSINLIINEKLYSVNLRKFNVHSTLNVFLRDFIGLTGTKNMCNEGGCGVCICVAKYQHPCTKKIEIMSINSCLTLLNCCDGYDITTVEGVGNSCDGYHAIQKRLVAFNGIQCGFCTPGIVMNMYGILERYSGDLTMAEIENSFGGNICRCTGYRSILQALKSFGTNSTIDIEDFDDKSFCRTKKKCLKWSLSDAPDMCMKYYQYKDGTEWYLPTNMADMLNIFQNICDKKYILISGNTGKAIYPSILEDVTVFITMNKIPELYEHEIHDQCIKIGGNVNLTECMEIFEQYFEKPGFDYLKEMYNHFDLIANVPIRNVASMAGNLIVKKEHPEFPSDIYTMLEALNAKIEILDECGISTIYTLQELRCINLYKKIVKSIILPEYCDHEYFFHSYKIMSRAQNTYANLNASFLFNIDLEKNKIMSARICYGGISENFVHAVKTEEFLNCCSIFEEAVLKECLCILQNEIFPSCVPPDTSPEYRILLACSLFYKTILTLAPSDCVQSNHRSGKSAIYRPVSTGEQIFSTNECDFPINQPISKIDGLLMSSGETFFINDLSKQNQELYAAFVYAKEVNRKIEKIDVQDVINEPGVVAFLSHKQIPGCNSFVDQRNPQYCRREEIFCSNLVKYYDQPAGLIVATSHDIAVNAAEQVKLLYERDEYPTVVLASMDAVFQSPPECAFNRILATVKEVSNISCNLMKSCETGKCETSICYPPCLPQPCLPSSCPPPPCFPSCPSPCPPQCPPPCPPECPPQCPAQCPPPCPPPKCPPPCPPPCSAPPSLCAEDSCEMKPKKPVCGRQICGYLNLRGQYHFPLEPHTTICIPVEDGIDVYSSTQWPDMTQVVISKALNVKQNSIHLQVRRIGGGFGFKISRGNQVACACALACHLLKRPVRMLLSLKSMMSSLGKRSPYHADYDIKIDDCGKILSLETYFYKEYGCFDNEKDAYPSAATMATTVYESNENWKCVVKGVLTDTPSNTYCRAPDSLEGIAVMETIMEHIAFDTQLDPAAVRLKNMNKNDKIYQFFSGFLGSTDYERRKSCIRDFNCENRWRKRGLGVSIIRYPVEYEGGFCAMVTIYHKDGSVSISHGGVEMGQGVNTKLIQTAAAVLQIPMENIRVLATDTFIGANSTVSGGSITSECVCYAVKDACDKLLKRLEPVRGCGNKSFVKVIEDAFCQNIKLSAEGYCKAGDLCKYDLLAASCCEVEIDVLTGNLMLRQVDITEDTGQSISPKIDIGQIEGAFVMGLGYWLMEELVVDEMTGQLLTNCTWNYKPPGPKDIPIHFNIYLDQCQTDMAGFLGSKTTGEPPTCLSVSIVNAIRYAIQSARSETDCGNEWFHLGAPTTTETIFLSCLNSIDYFKL